MTIHRSQSAMVSVSVHAVAIALLLLLSRHVVTAPHTVSTLPSLSIFDPPVRLSRNAIGGGGGQHQRTAASEGHLPKTGPQFVPPSPEIVNMHPKLTMVPTIEAPPDIAMLDRNLPNMGDPLSHIAGLSAGTGGPAGIGNSDGTGVGNRRGPGAGDGSDPLGIVYRPGGGVSVPVPIHKVEPEFSEEARKAKHTGTVMLRIDVDTAGRARNIRVVQSLGMGLDEKAVEAVSKWLFKPGTREGKPVTVTALVEVMFHLL